MGIESRAMLAKLTIGQKSFQKKDRRISNEVATQYGATADAGDYVKNLLPNARQELKRIQKIASKARIEHNKRTAPWLDNGRRILASGMYFEYIEVMRDYTTQFMDARNAFLDRYGEVCDTAPAFLKGLWDGDEYPSVEAVANSFYMDVNILPIPTGKDFRIDIGEAETEKIRNEINTEVEKAYRAAMRDLWNRLYAVVNELATAMRSDKSFKDTKIGNIIELVNMLPKMNMDNDPNLEEMRREVEKKICGYDPQTLRNSDKARQDAAKAADSILKKMEGYI